MNHDTSDGAAELPDDQLEQAAGGSGILAVAGPLIICTLPTLPLDKLQPPAES